MSEPAASAAPPPEVPATGPSLENSAYRAAVVDLLGVLAYGELSAFVRLAADAALAPTIADEAQLAEMGIAVVVPDEEPEEDKG
jgi:phage tail protein X